MERKGWKERRRRRRRKRPLVQILNQSRGVNLLSGPLAQKKGVVRSEMFEQHSRARSHYQIGPAQLSLFFGGGNRLFKKNIKSE